MENGLTNVAGVLTLLALQFATLCRVTHVARGWLLTCAGFLLYMAANGAFLWGCQAAGLSPLGVIQIGCLVMWLPLAALMVWLSHDDGWRTLFVALDYVAYLTAILPICHVLVFRKLAIIEGGQICAGIFLVAAHALFIFVLLPLVPRPNSRLPWRVGCIAAFILFVLLYATGIWPHSLVTGGWRQWVAFLLASAVAWVVFPMMYAGLRSYLRNEGIEQSLLLMTGEVAVRRATIEAARRQRHDLRHHRIALAEYLLRGQVDRALAYLEQLDDESAETPTDKLIWCENDTINAILSGYARKAAAKGVAFEVTVNVERAVNVPDIDFVAVVANLVENAINAAGKGRKSKSEVEVEVEERNLALGSAGLRNENRDHHSSTLDFDSRPRVAVALRQRERTIGMTVTNPVPSDFALSEEGLPCDVPGVGLESVRRVIERHQGELVYTLADGVLTCQTLLKIRCSISAP